jgi:phage/conjugal plasmid C-4 type zinc finger TraR family protein
MADDADLAADITAADLERTLARMRAAVAHRGHGPEWCEDCGEPISEARRRAVPWCTRCVICQERAERQEKGRS